MAGTELLLLSHGKVKSGSGGKLKSSAKRQAQKLGAALRDRGLAPDLTLSAPGEAAVVSAEKALKAGGWTARDIRTDARLATAAPCEAIRVLAEHPGRRLLCSGDGKVLSGMIEQLAPGSPALAPGALARLEYDDGRAPGAARLVELVKADALPDGFPWPGPGGEQRRERPAYYYSQSAALPYRLRGGEMEILLITSSSGRKWGIPKGICEPGLSPQDSAAHEALEEAGIRGRMHDASLGRYDVAKWGAVCSVEVFPMEVTGVLPRSQWDEPHRKRDWLSPDAAARRVSALGLAPIIRAFGRG